MIETRAQYDRYRKGFGGRVGDCPPGVTGCAFTLVDGTPTALRGHTSQFYTAGIGEIEDLEIAVEGAYVFLRSAYGDVTLGREYIPAFARRPNWFRRTARRVLCF